MSNLVPHDAIRELRGDGAVAFMPDLEPTLVVTPSVARVLALGIDQMHGALVDSQQHRNHMGRENERMHKVLTVYVTFLDNLCSVLGDDKSAAEIRDAAREVLAVMY